MNNLYCTPGTPTAGMTHSFISNRSFLVVILSPREGKPLICVHSLPFLIILLYLSVLRQRWAAYWTQMMNGCRLMLDSRLPLIDTIVSLHLPLLYSSSSCSEHSTLLRLRLVVLKEPEMLASTLHWNILNSSFPEGFLDGIDCLGCSFCVRLICGWK